MKEDEKLSNEEKHKLYLKLISEIGNWSPSLLKRALEENSYNIENAKTWLASNRMDASMIKYK